MCLILLKRSKERQQKRLVKDIKISPKEKKEKSGNMDLNDKKISLNMKKKGLLRIVKFILKGRKNTSWESEHTAFIYCYCLLYRHIFMTCKLYADASKN